MKTEYCGLCGLDLKDHSRTDVLIETTNGKKVYVPYGWGCPKPQQQFPKFVPQAPQLRDRPDDN